MLSIDLLNYEDCPHYEEAAQALRNILEEGDVLAESYMVSVSPGEDAETWGSIGSPTIHINGEDLEPEVDHGN
jgi:glutaredoxin